MQRLSVPARPAVAFLPRRHCATSAEANRFSPARVLERLGGAAGPSAAQPPLADLIRCCDTLAAGPLCSAEQLSLLLRAVALAPADTSQEAWASALRLVLCATKTATASEVEADGVECVNKDTDVWRNETETGVSSQAKACAAFLRCCVRHGAPLHVCRAAYTTLHMQCQSKDMTPVRQRGQWHCAYARVLLERSTSRDAKREALRVLLMDAPADGVALRKLGLLIALNLLHSVAVDGYTSFRTIHETPHPRTSENPKPMETEENAAGSAGNTDPVGNALWDTLCSDANVFVAVSTDICRAILTDPSADTHTRQEAIYSFAAIAGITSSSLIHQGDHDCVVFATLLVPFLNALGELLAERSCSREVASAMSTPRRNAPRETRFLAVTLVTGIVRQMQILNTRAVQVVGHVNTVGSSDSLELWRVGSAAALRCLRRILLSLPETHKAARQKAFCSAFRGVLDGVFYTHAASSSSPAQVVAETDVMATLAQMYGERDWHEPSVGMYIECLSAWRRFNEMRRVFTHLYRRDTKTWRSYRQMQEIKERGAFPEKVRWSSSLSLPTCQCVVHAACEAGDPEVGAMAIKQMLRFLLVAKSEQDEKDEESLTLNEESLTQWTQRVRGDLIPMVDKVFCKTQQDTEQNWLGDIHSN